MIQDQRLVQKQVNKQVSQSVRVRQFYGYAITCTLVQYLEWKFSFLQKEERKIEKSHAVDFRKFFSVHEGRKRKRLAGKVISCPPLFISCAKLGFPGAALIHSWRRKPCSLLK